MKGDFERRRLVVLHEFTLQQLFMVPICRAGLMAADQNSSCFETDDLLV